MVPWTDVINNAPKLADGAKKLWKTVAKKPSSTEISASSTQRVGSHGSQPIAALDSRTSALEVAVSDLHRQMLASSELIKALAEQNAQLVQRIESNRVRVLWLAAATAVFAITVCLVHF